MFLVLHFRSLDRYIAKRFGQGVGGGAARGRPSLTPPPDSQRSGKTQNKAKMIQINGIYGTKTWRIMTGEGEWAGTKPSGRDGRAWPRQKLDIINRI